MRIEPTAIDGVLRIEPTLRRDQRGLFYRAFCDQELEFVLHQKPIRQINISCTEAVGTVRGLHYQLPPSAESKLVRCLRGRVFDVAVDLRCNSSTFLHWVAEELSGDNYRMLLIPEGCAHGFQVLEPHSELLYLHTEPYELKLESGVRFDDPAVGIPWPLPVDGLSQRDANFALLNPEFPGVAL